MAAVTRAADIPAWRKAIYLVILLALPLALAEAAVRVRAWVKYGNASPGTADPMRTYNAEWDLYTPAPGYEYKGANTHVKINALGFRGDEIAREKPARTVRIVCLGASTTFSAEASSNDAIWTALLQRQLQADYPDVTIEVVNASFPGYTSAENLKNLRHRVLPLDPDLVLYYEANNEIVKDTRELALARGLTDDTRRHPVVQALVSHSLLADLVDKNLAIMMRSRATGPKLDDVPADLPDRFVRTLDEMRTLLEPRDVPLVLSTFIVKYRRDQDRPTQIANADVALYYMPWMSIDGMLAAMDRYNAALVAYGARAGLPVIDDRTAIPPDAAHFADCMHLTDRGNAAMAPRFYRGLKATGLVDSLVQRARQG
jgi:lysophospholipase L1-like esterase